MSKLPEPLILGQLIVVKYEYPGFTIYVQTDYVKGLVTLVEPSGTENHITQYVQKKWLFANREVEYLSGWRYIFDCLSDATKRAEEDLKAFQRGAEERKTQKLVSLLVAAGKYEDKK